MGWHVIFVETGKEDMVYTQINNILNHVNYTDYDLLIPKRKLQERHQGKFIEIVKKMFPGYILIRTNDPWDIFRKTQKLERLYRFLNQDCIIQEIRLEEIANIIYMVDEEGVIGISDIFVENDTVKVIDGPLCNYIGWIKKVDKHKRRVKVLFKFSGRDHLIDLSVNFIEKYEHVQGKELPFFYNQHLE